MRSFCCWLKSSFYRLSELFAWFKTCIYSAGQTTDFRVHVDDLTTSNSSGYRIYLVSAVLSWLACCAARPALLCMAGMGESVDKRREPRITNQQRISLSKCLRMSWYWVHVHEKIDSASVLVWWFVSHQVVSLYHLLVLISIFISI